MDPIRVPPSHPFSTDEVEAVHRSAAPSATNPLVTDSENDALDAGVVGAHAALTTGVHGAGASTLATVANVATHADLISTHGTGAPALPTTPSTLGKVHSAAAAPTGAANAASGFGPGWLWIDTTATSAACLYAYAYEAAGVAVWRRMLLGDEQAGITGALGGALTAANPALSKASRLRHVVVSWTTGIDTINTSNAAYQDTSRYVPFDKLYIDTNQYDYHIVATAFAMASTTQCGLKLTHLTNAGAATELGRVASEDLPAPLEVDDWLVAGIGVGGFRCARGSAAIVAATLNGLAAGVGGIYPSIRCDGTRTFYLYSWAIEAVPK